ncbi:MAG: TIGR02757 family protein [Candidatus Azobacteroides sp.]|nr:TIGR02757 family protein [Candidatus Azobacteroides sp.]
MPNKTAELLNRLVDSHNKPSFIAHDPIQFPRRFSRLQDIEISGFLISAITWGNRNMIIRNAEKMLLEMNHNPFEYILTGKFRFGKESLHRTFKWDDFAEICLSLQSFYRHDDSLENLFLNEKGELTFDKYKTLFTNKQISDWTRGSASKRLHLFLRWMVRNDGIVDIGCWKKIKPSSLFIPLDTHVARSAREKGLLERKTGDRKAVEELTRKLRMFCPEDPVKYDFALFGPGVE